MNQSAVMDRKPAFTTESVQQISGTPPRRRGRLGAVAAMSSGLVAMLAAAVLFSAPRSDASAPKTEVTPPVTSDNGASPKVALTDSSYVPGHSSGWHVHSGVHSVVVLSGTLTIYDQRCLRHDYGVGESYIGGLEPHLATNEGSTTVTVVVTFVSSPGALEHGRAVAEPAQCAGR